MIAMADIVCSIGIVGNMKICAKNGSLCAFSHLYLFLPNLSLFLAHLGSTSGDANTVFV